MTGRDRAEFWGFIHELTGLSTDTPAEREAARQMFRAVIEFNKALDKGRGAAIRYTFGLLGAVSLGLV
ncbi:MAG: hypothetical protein WAT93_14765, partial [Pontixanthobacter sp.]